MTNLDARIGQLREQMEESYLHGDKKIALEISRRLDKLIVLAQRTGGSGVVVVQAERRKWNVP
ncbi:MAG: aspartyl-phosphate phosphatase Spo0E family protein [Firmicutes bacterium]|nr:aspartyl-phosphate phosphatase Spo0E family protein [Bacillota bacterium]